MPRGDKEEEKRAERVRAIANSPVTNKKLQDDETMRSITGQVEEVGGTLVALLSVLSPHFKPATVAGLVLGTMGVALGHRDRQRASEIQAARQMRSGRRPS